MKDGVVYDGVGLLSLFAVRWIVDVAVGKSVEVAVGVGCTSG